MKKKLIHDKTFGTWCNLYWDCTEKELAKYVQKKVNYEIRTIGGVGKFIQVSDSNGIYTFVGIWLKGKKGMDTLSHEVLHMVKFWLFNYYKIGLSDETEEIYTILHSFYMREMLQVLGHDKWIS